MSLFKKKQSNEAKKRFQNMMLAGKENPDRVYDLSNCELASVPPEIFSSCRVFLAESLLLHSNWLKSFKGKMADLSSLRVLDLHNNNLKSLPDDISQIKHLQILNVQQNNLKELPQSIGSLTKLQSLLARDNHLNSLPETVKGMSSLRTLDISGTNKVYYLPRNLCLIRTLEVLLLSSVGSMEYPAPFICEEGLEAIQKRICKDTGVEYIPPSHQALKALDISPMTSSSSSSTLGSSSCSPLSDVENVYSFYQKAKDEKMKRQMELEKAIQAEKEEQIKLAASAAQANVKSQELVKEEMKQQSKAIFLQQERADKERKELFASLQKAELEASVLVNKLVSANEVAKHNEEMLLALEKQRIEEEDHFRVTKEEMDRLSREETLATMQLMVAENDAMNLMIRKYLGEQEFSHRKAAESMETDDEKIKEQMKQQELKQADLINVIMNEEEIQKELFSALQSEQDIVQIRLRKQIEELQSELIKLTFIEAEKRKNKVKDNADNLMDVRLELSSLLGSLLKQQQAREEDLTNLMYAMEKQKEDDQLDFWLVQYQRLLDTKPEQLIRKENYLDTEVVRLLHRAGAEDHIPEFARHKITPRDLFLLDEEKLRRIGVFEVGSISSILQEVESLISIQKKATPFYEPSSSKTPVEVPSAPETPAETPSTSSPTAAKPPAPVASILDGDDEVEIENECVICLDKQSDAVFLPCGHVCCCLDCSANLELCPMCRTAITQKIRIYRPS